MSATTASSAGDLGDIVAGVLGTLASIPGRHTLYLRDDGHTKGIVKRASLVIPLVEAQPYMVSCKVWDKEYIEWPSELFRNGHHSTTSTLLSSHASHAKSMDVIKQLPSGREAWLTVEPKKGLAGNVVINRTDRYNNPHFPWAQVVKHYGSRILFVGLPHEYEQFQNNFGPVDYRKAKDLLELARIIAGSALFIGNQSAAMTIAEGLKHPRILEVSLTVCDCIYPGSTNAQHVVDGTVTLPDIDGSGELNVPPTAYPLENVSTMYIPPRGWIFDSEETGPLFTSHIDTLARDITKKLKGEITREEARHRALLYNIRHQSAHFSRYMQVPSFSRPKAALKAAGVTNHPILNPDPIALVR